MYLFSVRIDHISQAFKMFETNHDLKSTYQDRK